jgi:hypothetical protein
VLGGRRGTELRARALGLRAAAEAQVGIDELGTGSEVDIGDLHVVEALLLALEVLDRALGLPEPEFELAERGGRPELMQPGPELACERKRLGRECTTLLRASAAGLQPGQPGEAEAELALLTRFASEVDGLPVGCLGHRAAVRRRLVTRCQVEEERQRADRGALARGGERAREQ